MASRLYHKENHLVGCKVSVGRREHVDEAVWGRTEGVHCANCLLILEFFKHLQGFLRRNSLFTLKNDKMLEQSAVEKFIFTATGLPPVFASLGIMICR